MKRPNSTYRLQLNADFNFEKLDKMIDYLDKLGISTIYAAPFFEARKGSTHGYDNIDPLKINPEIGTLEEFRKLRAKLKQRGISWLQDIVPNHMAFDPANPWIREILELGPDSRYYNFFDINWEYKGLKKVMAPFLGKLKEEVLESADMKLEFHDGGFMLNYFEHNYPLNVKTYPVILENSGLREWKIRFDSFYGDYEDWKSLKTSFCDEINGNPDGQNKLTERLKEINSSHNLLREILQLQYFLPVYWKTTEQEINYRRFFTINHLICLRIEERNVYEKYHSFIKQLIEEDLIDGLRIDHIDGLFDPLSYLKWLRSSFGDDIYLVVEKILEREEELPKEWPVQGSTGYEFLAVVNQLLTDKNSEEKFREFYRQLVPEIPELEKLIFEKKLFILESRMMGELQNLCHLMLSGEILDNSGFEDEVMRKALEELLAAFPVYRIYPKKIPLRAKEKQVVEEAFQKAVKYASVPKQVFEALKPVFLGEWSKNNSKALYFLQRCQQFTGPLAAKGVEDTVFYIYNPLISHNEVGDSPEHLGLPTSEFHNKMKRRIQDFPLAMSATATHDTKRGEDSRMRLNVLSEIPDEFFEKVKNWQELNSKLKESNAPDANEEYFLYQSLLAVKPFREENDFTERTRAYMQKVLREAKLNSSWAGPDQDYEKQVLKFIENIWDSKAFRSSFDPFWEKVSYYGVLKSLGQLSLKCTSPGVPDIYQGTELWDLCYVDPDNRRPVDYQLREQYLKQFKKGIGVSGPELKQNYKDGRIKLYTLCRLLDFRNKNTGLFTEGEYKSMKLACESAEKYIAFTREHQGDMLLVIVPLFVTAIFSDKGFIPVKGLDTYILMKENFPGKWKSIFDGSLYEFENKIFLKDLLSEFPVVVLKNEL